MDRKVGCHIVQNRSSCDRVWFWQCLGARHSRTTFLDQKSSKIAPKSVPEALLDEFELGPSWTKLAKLGLSWGQVGAKSGLCWRILAASWQSQRKVTQHVAEDGQDWPQKTQHSFQIVDFGRVLGFMLAPKN